MFRFLSIDNFNFKGKIVGVRVDLNSPIINDKVVNNERIKASAHTIKELLKKDAKIVLLAHQGRKGKSDFKSLKEHSKLLSKELKKDVKFISEVYSESVVKEIKSLKPREILLLENVRFLDDEEFPNKKNNQILKLEKLFDCYVQDAFSVCHREHTSIVGFKNVPIVAGKTVEKEILGLNHIEETNKPHFFLFGGAKPDDLVELIEVAIKKKSVDKILLTGIIGELALHIKGYHIGKKLKFIKEQEFSTSLSKLKKLVLENSHLFEIPKDVAYFNGKKRVEILRKDLEKNKALLDTFLIQDVGSETISYYSKLMKTAGSIYMKGPAGNFEAGADLDYGTKKLLISITKTNAFTFMGGGHSVTAAKMFIDTEKISYVSLAGGALVRFLSGKNLPGLDVIQNSFDMYEKQNKDFIVVGSNVLDISVNLPGHLSEISLGDKIRINQDFKTTIGGGGLNVSVCLNKLGARVGYLGKLSEENLFQVKETLEKQTIDLIYSEPTSSPVAKSIILDTKDNDRVLFTYRGQNPNLRKTDFALSEVLNTNSFYFSSLTGDSFLTLCWLSKKIKENNKDSLICYNPSSYLIKQEKVKVKSLIKNSDVLVLNYDEAKALVGEKSIGVCLRDIKDLVSKVVIITDGKHGAYGFDGKNEYFQKSLKVSSIVYTTGAGDCFSGTFFYFFTKGYGIKKSMYFAAKNAASLISKKGAQNGLLNYKELK